MWRSVTFAHVLDPVYSDMGGLISEFSLGSGHVL